MDARDPQSPSPSSTERSGQPKGFLRAVLLLVSGTALAHGITGAAMPLLSRLYSPTEFGLLAVLAACIAILSAVACMRFDLAIALPASQREAKDVLQLALICCISLSALLAIPILVAPQIVSRALAQEALEPYLWLLPLGVLLAGSQSALQFWHVRQKSFGLLATTKVVQSAGAASVQLAAGFSSAGPIGLLAGPMINAGVACLALGRVLGKTKPWMGLPRLKYLASYYRRFPMISAPEALANTASSQLPLILIAAMAAPAEAGYLTMAIFAIQAPMALIGTAIGQVYLSQAPDAWRSGRLADRTGDVFGGLWRAGVGPLLFIGAMAPLLFEPVFGNGWERAGWLVTWMTPWFIAQFLAVPLSMALHIVGHQKRALCLQLFGMILRNGIVLATVASEPTAVAEAFAISGAIFYIVYLAVIAKSVGLTQTAILAEVYKGARPLAAWCALAGMLWPITIELRRSLG